MKFRRKPQQTRLVIIMKRSEAVDLWNSMQMVEGYLETAIPNNGEAAFAHFKSQLADWLDTYRADGTIH